MLDENSNSSSFRFAVAFSFPGEHRKYVEEVDKKLSQWIDPEKVFYDSRFLHEIAGINSDRIIQDIYHNQSELVVVFLCKEYEEKDWCCNIEWRAIRNLIKTRTNLGRNSILPLRFDDSDIPGVYSIDIIPDLQGHTPQKTAELIWNRLKIVRRDNQNLITVSNNEYDKLLKKYKKLVEHLSIKIERLEEIENECEAFKILYIQNFSKYLSEKKDLEIDIDLLSDEIQKLQYISKNKIHYIEILNNYREFPESNISTSDMINILSHESLQYELSYEGKDLYIAALSPQYFLISKYSYPKHIMFLTIQNNNTLIIKTESGTSTVDIKARLFQMEDISKLLEFSEKRKEYEQEKDNINECVSIKVNTSSLGKDQIKEMKDIYREIMKHIHPDIYGGKYPEDWDDEKVKNFDKMSRISTEAYKIFDIETIRQVYEEIKGKNILIEELETERDIKKIKDKITWYEKRIDIINSKIEELRRSDIYSWSYVLKNPEKNKETEQKLKEANEQLRATKEKLKEEKDQLFNDYRKQSCNE